MPCGVRDTDQTSLSLFSSVVRDKMMRGGAGRSAARRAASCLEMIHTSITRNIGGTLLPRHVVGGVTKKTMTMTTTTTATTREASFLRGRLFHSSAAAPRAVGPVGAAAAAVGARAAVGIATNALKLRAAQNAYAAVTTETFRSRVQRAVLGRTYAGAAARVAGLAATAGVGTYALLEPVPATGRWRLMLFDHDTEATLLKPSVSHQFQVGEGLIPIVPVPIAPTLTLIRSRSCLRSQLSTHQQGAELRYIRVVYAVLVRKISVVSGGERRVKQNSVE